MMRDERMRDKRMRDERLEVRDQRSEIRHERLEMGVGRCNIKRTSGCKPGWRMGKVVDDETCAC